MANQSLVKITILLGLGGFGLLGCSKNFSDSLTETNTQPSTSTATSISGKVTPYTGVTVSSVGSSCTSVSVSLYSIDASDQISSTSLATTTMAADGTYTFKNVPNLADSSTVQYIVKASGCGVEYSRPVTGGASQDISYSSTLLSLSTSISDASRKKLSATSKNAVLQLISSLAPVEQSSMAATYQAIVANANLSTLYRNVTNVQPTVLASDLPPLNWTLNGSELLHEGTANLYTVNASAWNKSDSLAYMWNLDGKVVSTSSTWNYVISKNSQGSHLLKVQVGTALADGSFDITKPISNKSLNLIVSDDFKTVAPPATLSASNYTQQSQVTLNINTGTLLTNCDTLSGLAITENAYVPPLAASSFTLQCSTAPTQTQTYNLSAGDGVKTVALWAINSSGQISTTASVNTVILDRTPPQITLGPMLGASLTMGQTRAVSFTAADSLSGVSSLLLMFTSDGVNYSQVADLTSAVSPISWLIPSVATSSAKLKLVAVDRAGNTSQVISDTFSIVAAQSTTPPVQVPAVATSTLAVNPTSLSADGVTNATITLLLKDSSGKALANYDASAFQLQVTGSNNTLVNFSGSTNASGQISATLSSTVPEVKTVSLANAGWSSLSSNVTFTQAAHPRLILNPARLQKMKSLLKAGTNPILNSYLNQVVARANVYVGQSPPVQFGTTAGNIMAPLVGSTVLSPFIGYIVKSGSTPVSPQSGYYQVASPQNNQNLLRDIASAISSMAMAYALTGDTKYSDTIDAWVLAVTNYYNWDERFTPVSGVTFTATPDPTVYSFLAGDNGPSLATGSFLYSLALSYDWCQSVLPDSTLAAIRSSLKYHAGLVALSGGPVVAGVLNSGFSWWKTDYQQNHNEVAFSALAAAAAAIYPEESAVATPWLNQALTNFKNMQAVLNDDGGTAEGVSYATYMISDTMKANQILKDELGVDFLLDANKNIYPFWQNVGNYIIYHINPKASWVNGQGTFFGYNDVSANPWYGPNTTLRSLASLNQNTDLQGFADLLDVLPTGQIKNPVNSNTDWELITTYDTNLASTDYSTSASFPLFKIFSQYGEAISRSDWTSPYGSVILYRSGHPAGGKASYVLAAPNRFTSGHYAPAAGSFAIHGGDVELLRTSGYVDAKYTIAQNSLVFKCDVAADGTALQSSIKTCDPTSTNIRYLGRIGQLGEDVTGVNIGLYYLTPAQICGYNPAQYWSSLSAITNPVSYGLTLPSTTPSPISNTCSTGPMVTPVSAQNATTQIVNFCNNQTNVQLFPNLCRKVANIVQVTPNANWNVPSSEPNGVDYVIEDASAAYDVAATNMQSFKRHLIYLRNHNVLLEVSEVNLLGSKNMELLYHTTYVPVISSSTAGNMIVDGSGGSTNAFKMYFYDQTAAISTSKMLVDPIMKSYLQTVTLSLSGSQWLHTAAFSWMPPKIVGTTRSVQTPAVVTYASVPATSSVPASHQFTVTDASGASIVVNVNTSLQSVQIH